MSITIFMKEQDRIMFQCDIYNFKKRQGQTFRLLSRLLVEALRCSVTRLRSNIYLMICPVIILQHSTSMLTQHNDTHLIMKLKPNLALYALLDKKG